MAKQWHPKKRRMSPVLAGLMFMMVLVAAGNAAGTEQRHGPFWTESRTGIAIGGFDPVAYYVDHAPRRGLPAHETVWNNHVWRFSSAANKAVFERDPHVYAPRFGGHDAYQLAEGYVAAGSPHIWMIADDALYLFRSARHRQAWMAADAKARARANAAWPSLALETR